MFIVFEGGEGCGKSTQTRALYRYLRREGLNAILTREPGGTRLGEQLRRCIKQPALAPVSAQAELFLLAAARSQLVSEVIQPQLKGNGTVICDRFTPSTLAYQGYGRGLDPEMITLVNEVATGGLYPDLVVLLDVPVEVGLERKKGGGRDRFEQEGVGFHNRVRQGYLEMARADPARWLIIDGSLPKKVISARIRERVNVLISGGAHA